MKSISRKLQVAWLLHRLWDSCPTCLRNWCPTNRRDDVGWLWKNDVFTLGTPYRSKLLDPLNGPSCGQAPTWKAKKCWPPEVADVQWPCKIPWFFCWENQWLPNVASGCWRFHTYIYIYIVICEITGWSIRLPWGYLTAAQQLYVVRTLFGSRATLSGTRWGKTLPLDPSGVWNWKGQ